MSIGGDSRLIREDLRNVVGLFDVTEQSDYPRSVVDLEQIMDAPVMKMSEHCSNLYVTSLRWNVVAGSTSLRVDCSHQS